MWSLYNESPTGSVDPTPTVWHGWLDRERAMDYPARISTEDDLIWFSRRARRRNGRIALFEINPRLEDRDSTSFALRQGMAVHQFLIKAIRSGWVQSSHELFRRRFGGRARASHASPGEVKKGAGISIGAHGLRTDELLFNESQSRILFRAGQTQKLSCGFWRTGTESI